MSHRLQDALSKSWEYIDSGKLDLAESEIADIEASENADQFKQGIDLLKVLYYLEIRQPEQAKTLLDNYLLQLDDLPTPLQLEILNLDSKIKIHQSEFMKAESTLHRLNEKLAKQSDSERNMQAHIHPDSKNALGLVLASQGDYQAAITAFEEATMGFRKQDRYRQRAMAMFNHGKILSMLGQLDRATALLDEASIIFKEIQSHESLSHTYDALIEIQKSKGDRDAQYTYAQLKQNLKDKVEFEKMRRQGIQERETLQSQLSDANDKIKELEEKIFSLKFEVDATTPVSDSKSLLSEIDRQKLDSYDGLEQEHEELKAKHHKLFMDKDELEHEIKSYREQLDKILEPKKELAQERFKNEMLLADIDDLKKELEEMSNNPGDSEEVENLQKANADLTAKISYLEEERQKLEAEIESAIIQTEEQMEEKLKVKEDEISKLQNDISQMLTQKSNLENALSESSEHEYRIMDLEGQLAAAKRAQPVANSDELDALRAKVAELERRPAVADTTQLDIIQQDLNVAKQRIDELLKELEATKTDAEALRGQQVSLQQEISTSKGDLDRLRSEQGSLEQELSKALTDLQTANQKVEQLESELEELQKVPEPEPEPIQEPEVVETEAPEPPQQNLYTPSFTSSSRNMDLESLLASDKLIDYVFTRLKSMQSVNLRILAMQAGVSSQKCRDAVDQLVMTGAVAFNPETNIVSIP